MDRCIDVVAQAMQAASAGSISLYPRMLGQLVDKSGFLGVMPGSAADPAVYGAKVAGILPGTPANGRPAINGFVVLFDNDTGTPYGMVDGGELTALRTGAASGLATRLLARKDARTHGIFGTGVQAYSHARAILAARPALERTLIWGRDPNKAKSVAAALEQELGQSVQAVADPGEAAGADIVSAVTGAKSPILFGADVRPGAHVNLAGAHRAVDREADSALMQAGRIFVDLVAGAMQDAGDILIPIQEGVLSADGLIEIGALVDGTARGRVDANEITIYKSVGTVAQDIFTAHAALKQAEASGIGQVVEL